MIAAAFDLGIQGGTCWRQQDDLGVGHFIHVGAQWQELAVAVNEEEARSLEESALVGGQVAGHLLFPVPVRVRGDSCDFGPASFEAHSDQNVEGDETGSGPYFASGEVNGCDRVPVGLEEGFPSRCRRSFRGRFDAVLHEEVSDGAVGDPMAEICQGALNSIIAQVGFSLAKRRTSRAMQSGTGGRPRAFLRRSLKSRFAAMRRLYQRRIVSGVTMDVCLMTRAG